MLKCFATLSVVVMFCLSASFIAAVEKPLSDSEATAAIVEGKARVYKKGDTTGSALKQGDTIRKDSTIKVAEKSRVEILFPDGTIMRLSDKSQLVMNDIAYDRKSEGKNVKVNLSFGKVWAKVRKLVTPDSRVEVNTGNAVAGVRGTVYQVNVDEDKSALVKVYDGSVSVASPPKEVAKPATQVSGPVPVAGPHEVPPPQHEVSMEEWTVIVKAMQQISISPQGVASKPQDFDARADADDWVKWNQERDKQTQL